MSDIKYNAVMVKFTGANGRYYESLFLTEEQAKKWIGNKPIKVHSIEKVMASLTDFVVEFAETVSGCVPFVDTVRAGKRYKVEIAPLSEGRVIVVNRIKE